MKVRTKTPDSVLVSFNRREIMVMTNCLHEACHGLTMDRFVPAHQDLQNMLKDMDAILDKNDLFRLKPVPV